MNQHNAVAETGAVLTDEQFGQLLAERHDTANSPADAALARTRAALGSYRAETLQWAERRSATQPSLVPAAARAARWAALPRWSLATVALVTILGGLAHLSEYGFAAGHETSTAVVEHPAAADIAADNRLLSSINAELNYHSDSPVDALGLQDSDTPIRAAEDGVTE